MYYKNIDIENSKEVSRFVCSVANSRRGILNNSRRNYWKGKKGQDPDPAILYKFVYADIEDVPEGDENYYLVYDLPKDPDNDVSGINDSLKHVAENAIRMIHIRAKNNHKRNDYSSHLNIIQRFIDNYELDLETPEPYTQVAKILPYVNELSSSEFCQLIQRCSFFNFDKTHASVLKSFFESLE